MCKCFIIVYAEFSDPAIDIILTDKLHVNLFF